MAAVIIIALFLGLIFGVICFTLADRADSSRGGCFALGFFFGLLGLLITVVLTHEGRRANRYAKHGSNPYRPASWHSANWHD